MKNHKVSLLQNAKFRVIAALLVFAVIAAAGIGIWRYLTVKNTFKSESSIASPPSIESLPGVGDATDAYVQAQNEQNALGVQEARRDATSFVPTITRHGFSGDASVFTDEGSHSENNAKKSECPINKSVVMFKPNPANCSVDNLILARKAGVTAEELICQACPCDLLRAAGYTVGELKTIGLKAKDLRACGFSKDALKTAGFTPGELKEAGFTAPELRAMELSPGELAQAGFTVDELKAAGLTAADFKKAGVSAEALKAAGFSALALKEAGYSAHELKNAGFDAQSLKNAGFSAKALKNAGFPAALLKESGFDSKELHDAGFSAAELKKSGFSANELKSAGFDANTLKQGGFSVDELASAGFTPNEIKTAELLSNSCSDEMLRKARLAGVSAIDLKNKGCGLSGLKTAGFTASELKNAGFTAAALKDLGYSADDLKSAGYTVSQLKTAGFTPEELKKAGFTAQDLISAGVQVADLKKAGFAADELHNAGVNARSLKDLGFTANDLKHSGYDAAQLKALGYTAGDLKSAGFTPKQLKVAGYTAHQLRVAGVPASALKASGYGVQELEKAGYTSGDLLRAGFPQKTERMNSNVTAQSAAPNRLRTTQDEFTANETNHFAQSSATMPSIASNTPEARLREIQQLQQEKLNLQQRHDMEQQLQGQMSLQAQKLMTEWSNNGQQTLHSATPPTEPVGNLSVSGDAGQKTEKSGGPVIKAGSILFAVLDTGVNSDEPSPILATVVSGNLKGSKLIGKFTRVDKRVLLSFNVMNVEEFDHTIGVNAVAIDENTARTAVSGNVNSHYLLRYGSLFASAFLSGVSQGVIQSGTTEDCFLGICHKVHDKITPGEYVALGLGNVGQQYAATMGQNFNVPPTIKIEGGTGMGILFMSDVTLPKPLKDKK